MQRKDLKTTTRKERKEKTRTNNATPWIKFGFSGGEKIFKAM
jgi:hypothetical protein